MHHLQRAGGQLGPHVRVSSRGRNGPLSRARGGHLVGGLVGSCSGDSGRRETGAPKKVLWLWVRKGAVISGPAVGPWGRPAPQWQQPPPPLPPLLHSAVAVATGAGPHPCGRRGAWGVGRGLGQGRGVQLGGSAKERGLSPAEARRAPRGAASCGWQVGTSREGGCILGAGKGPGLGAPTAGRRGGGMWAPSRGEA